MTRGLTLQIRVNEAEKRRIEINAQAVGKKPGPFLRELGLSGSPVTRVPMTPPQPSPPAPTPAPPASGVKPSENVDAEVAEARLADDPAREAFVTRRTRELFGQGKTSKLAQALAEAEWTAR